MTVPADKVHPAQWCEHSRVRPGTPTRHCWCRALQSPILTLPERLKRGFLSVTSLSTASHPFASPLSFCLPLPGSWGSLLTWHLAPVGSVHAAAAPSRQPAGPSVAAVYRQEGLRCVTLLAPIKDNVIAAPIVPVYICWWEKIIGLSELEQGMLENYESESCLCQETLALCWFNKGFFSIAMLINSNLPLFLPTHMEARGRVWRGGVGKGRDLHAKPEVNLPGASHHNCSHTQCPAHARPTLQWKYNC